VPKSSGTTVPTYLVFDPAVHKSLLTSQLSRYVEDREGFERVMTYHVRAYGLRRAKQVQL